jgi:hypothetical protein
MAEQQGEPGERGVAAAVPEHDREEPELADRAEGEDALEVGLAQRLESAEQHREHAERDDDRAPRRCCGEYRGEEGDEVDAGLHHRRGVQVRADRGRRGHRAGEPEVEGEDRRLAQGPHEQQHERRVDDRAGRRLGEDGGDARSAGVDDHQHDADEHDESAERRHQQGLQRGAAAGRAAVVVADEQVRQDARDLPEHHENDEVVGEHEAVHRAREREQHGGELAEVVGLPPEVPAAVDHDESADARDDERHEPAEGVHAHRQLDAERRDPRVRLERRIPCEDGRAQCHRLSEGDDRQHRRDVEGAGADAGGQPRKDQRHERERAEDEEHGGLLMVVGRGLPRAARAIRVSERV